MRREYQGALVSCRDSFAVVDLPTGAHQLALDVAKTGHLVDEDALPLF
ncbi:hypothetical protein ACH5AL_15250 [Actinacidiphila glaucinigra]